MESTVLPFGVAEPRKRIRQPIGITIAPAIQDRLKVLAAQTGLSSSRIIEKALEDRLSAYEKDPGELMRRPLEPKEVLGPASDATPQASSPEPTNEPLRRMKL